MKKITLLLLFISLNPISSQENHLLFSTIPENLLENANSVLRVDDTSIELTSIKSLKHSYTRVLTVLNKNGNSKVNAYLFYDKKTRIKKLEASFYDRNGKLIKKYKKSDFEDQSAVNDFSLYEDNRVKFVNYTPISYPYTVEFRYETQIENTAHIPFWRPLEGYLISTENSTYSVQYEESIGGVNIKEKNFEGYEITNSSKEGLVSYTAKNIKSLKPEHLSSSFSDFGPRLLVAPRIFYYEGHYGSAKDWKSMGKWMYDELLVGRDQVSDATKNQIRLLVKGIEDPLEKAKIVYKFVQNNTRYISVQEGIGGIQPISASNVDRVKYGDCKGLTNYTKALLDVAGVTSYYTRLYASPSNQASVDKEFVSFLGQTNHVILNIPNKGEDIWLECTSQTMPFGFLGDFTDNRDVFVITPEGGMIKRTPAYLNEDNLQFTNAIINLNPSGNLKAEVERKSTGTQYDNSFFVESKSKEELNKYYKENLWDYNNNLEINSIHFENNKDSIVFSEKLDVEINDYASINESEFIFRVNVFNRNSHVPKRYRNRKLPFNISRGYKDVDNFVFKIPEGYSISILPEPVELSSKFGYYKMSISKIDDSSFQYKKEILIKNGQYPKEDYNAYRKFRRSIARYENKRIALTKK